MDRIGGSSPRAREMSPLTSQAFYCISHPFDSYNANTVISLQGHRCARGAAGDIHMVSMSGKELCDEF